MFGLALVVLGVGELALGWSGGLWTAFLGWFLLNAAAAEERHHALRQGLVGVRARDVMRPSVAVSDSATAAKVAGRLGARGATAMPLVPSTAR